MQQNKLTLLSAEDKEIIDKLYTQEKIQPWYMRPSGYNEKMLNKRHEQYKTIYKKNLTQEEYGILVKEINFYKQHLKFFLNGEYEYSNFFKRQGEEFCSKTYTSKFHANGYKLPDFYEKDVEKIRTLNEFIEDNRKLGNFPLYKIQEHRELLQASKQKLSNYFDKMEDQRIAKNDKAKEIVRAGNGEFISEKSGKSEGVTTPKDNRNYERPMISEPPKIPLGLFKIKTNPGPRITDPVKGGNKFLGPITNSTADRGGEFLLYSSLALLTIFAGRYISRQLNIQKEAEEKKLIKETEERQRNIQKESEEKKLIKEAEERQRNIQKEAQEKKLIKEAEERQRNIQKEAEEEKLIRYILEEFKGGPPNPYKDESKSQNAKNKVTSEQEKNKAGDKENPGSDPTQPGINSTTRGR